MTRDKLYEAAFRYKKTGLWKKLWDTEIFAVKLKKGKIGYVTIMGANGEYCALGLYIGYEGLKSLINVAKMEETVDEFKKHEISVGQNCLQVALSCKEDLLPEELEEVREYAKQNSIRLSGKNAYPQFIKNEPGCFPWNLTSEEDMEYLYAAMEAAILLSEELKKKEPLMLGIDCIGSGTKQVVLFEVKQGKLLSDGFAEIPELSEEHYEYVKVENEDEIDKMKKFPKKGIWEAEVIMMMKPVQINSEEAPYFPLLALMVDSKSYSIYPVTLVKDLVKEASKILTRFVTVCQDISHCPKLIRCRDERTYAFFKDICEKSGIKICKYEDELPALDFAENELLKQMSVEKNNSVDDDILFDSLDDEIEQKGVIDNEELKTKLSRLINTILALDDNALQFVHISEGMMNELKLLLEFNVLPKQIASELAKKLKKLSM